MEESNSQSETRCLVRRMRCGNDLKKEGKVQWGNGKWSLCAKAMGAEGPTEKPIEFIVKLSACPILLSIIHLMFGMLDNK